jgi:hypothetical protein
MPDLRVRSTSSSSAVVSDIVLRETTVTRLVFRPMLVDNPHNRDASVKGTFIFQRKGPKETWSDVPVEPLTALKKGEGYHLDLKSGEILDLYTQLTALYRLHAREGIPSGEAEYVRAQGAILSLSELSNQQLRTFLDANSAAGADLIRRLLTWASESDDVDQLVELLESVGHRALGNLNAAVSMSSIKEALAVWEAGEHDNDEEFWQIFLTDRSFLLEQLFSWPCTVVAEKAYVGGKNVENRSGNIVDFLVKNQLTHSAALVEIKKPSSPLVGRPYREGIPNIAVDLAGSVVQVLSYKSSLNETYLTLSRSAPPYEVFDPPCVVITGRAKSLASPEQRRSFELFRRQLKGVVILAFDELFGRLQFLVRVLESRSAPVPSPPSPAEEEPESNF